MRARAVVTGAGGFIGHHLVKYLKANGYWIRGVDVKHPEYQASQADEFELLDLRDRAACLAATHGMSEAFQLAVDMGGIGYITAVRGRNSDNTLASHVLGWQPSIPLERGLTETYRWIASRAKGVDPLVQQAMA